MKKAMRQIIITSLISLFAVSPLLAQEEIPEAAMERFKAGFALIEKADKPADFLAAIGEFEAAAALAPQWADIHYNLAKLAAETDKPAKAIKEYRTYLALTPDGAERAAVEGDIARLKETIARKRKLGLPGVVFAAMPDGIWVMELSPGSRVGKTFLRKGYKILAVEDQSVVGAKLDDFFRAIETQSAKVAAAKSEEKKQPGQIPAGFMAEIGYIRSQKFMRTSQPNNVGNTVEETGPAIAFTIIPPGSGKGYLYFKKSMFHSNVIEIEEDEFEDEVLKESLPVVVTFWGSDCGPCQDFVPAVEAQGAKYAGKVKFVNVNVNENRKLVNQLAVKGVPTMMVYKGGSPVSTTTGRIDNAKLAELLQGVAAH
ncbi:thioredoxin domain-containing protein [Geobacter grbiciae]|uniref:thioredoxin domain-containing protein n=1 Tax=Geobacter grbiciae TaxID=155042 RepID=UPI001C03662C|nr:thioredoxin domain-containing protein [Geobacter grbiciae]MBT1075625.1 thioredoxin family protein [Geobacter grbiciae]